MVEATPTSNTPVSTEELSQVDWFMDPEIHHDPYPYYEFLRAKGPAVYLPEHNVVAVTNYDEVMKIFRDGDQYSAINAVTGPFPPLPFTPEGDDITPQIESHRETMAHGDLLMTMDRPRHAKYRGVLTGLITPKRLRQNEEFILKLCDRQIATILEKGKFEIITDLAHPLSVLVVADLLGVPESEHDRFLELLPAAPGSAVGGNIKADYNPLEALASAMYQYIADRRSNPRDDVLTSLAQAKFPDGTLPDIGELVGLAAFLFAAGQDTVVRLFGNSLRVLGDNLELQSALRSNPARLSAFIEEMLRFESPSKVDFRLTRVPVRIGDLDIAPGTTVMMMIGAANRDPNKFEDPNRVIVDRPNASDHIAFGRGIHACVGAPLARSEIRIALERLLARTADIRISEEKHGPPSARRYEYPARYTMRGPKELFLEVTPA